MTAPAGFKGAYERARRYPTTARVLSDLLALVGYDAHPSEIARWSLERRVEAEVYAVNVHLRASDNKPMRKHPRPAWMPEPWGGIPEGESILDTQGGTPLGVREAEEAIT